MATLNPRENARPLQPVFAQESQELVPERELPMVLPLRKDVTNRRVYAFLPDPEDPITALPGEGRNPFTYE